MERTYWEPSLAGVGLVSPEMMKLKVGSENMLSKHVIKTCYQNKLSKMS